MVFQEALSQEFVFPFSHPAHRPDLRNSGQAWGPETSSQKRAGKRPIWGEFLITGLSAVVLRADRFQLGCSSSQSLFEGCSPSGG